MYPRSAKRRKRKHRKLGLRMLQSGVAVSVLLLYTSGQIGSTYGGFNTSQEQNSSIGLCSVFPGEIERLLTEFSGHLRTLRELKASLHGYSVSGAYNYSFNNGEMSQEGLSQAAEDVSAQLLQAGSELNALDMQLSLNAGVWQQILQETRQAAAILQQLGGYMENLDPGCLEIRDVRFFGQIEESLQSSGILSESLNETLSGIMHYLNSIHDLGGSLPTSNPDRVLLQKDPGFGKREPVPNVTAAVYSDDSGVAPELQAFYSGLNTEMTAAKEDLASTISSLQQKQIEIAEAQAALQDKAKALEQAKEEAAAEQAKQQQAEEQAQAGGAAPSPAPSGTPPPAGPPGEEAPAAQPGPDPQAGGQPDPAQTKAPQPEAAAPVPSATPDVTAGPGLPLPEVTDGTTPVNEPEGGQSAATPAPVDSPSPAPSSDISKGGD
ncbi:hypothetical protein MHI24_18355 [Paenibacillus sp. FSL K6-1096]|uniref:hypothetical protein n=1 Tax=Paenibacillus sp. FSL K6-1096 TaxID=2921460 RepID=UPI0030EC86A7